MEVRWLFAGTFVGSLLVGYLLAAIFFFPAPFFSANTAVPRVIDMPIEEAQAALEAADLIPGDPRRENHPSYASGHVAWQDPPEGVRVPPGTIVRLAISRGPQEIPVPDVSRYDSDLAEMLIVRSGLTVRELDSIQTALPRGVAVGSRPAVPAERRVPPAGRWRTPATTDPWLIPVRITPLVLRLGSIQPNPVPRWSGRPCSRSR